MLCGISPPFEGLFPTSRAGYPRVTHPSATVLIRPKANFLVRLACVRHAASVRSEPGSNSPVKKWIRWRTIGSLTEARNQKTGMESDEPTHSGLRKQ